MFSEQNVIETSHLKLVNAMLDGMIKTDLKIISAETGSVMHALKISEPGFKEFGEVYFSMVDSGAIKGWKRHKEMVLNLVVSAGAVRFVLYDDRPNSASCNHFQEIILSKDKNYSRLTVPPMVWMGFQGMGADTNMLLNIVDMEHSSEEIDRLTLNGINFNWER